MGHIAEVVAAKGLVPTVAGHTLLNLSMRTLRSQTVAVLTLGQFIAAGILAWIIFDELPTVQFPIAAGLVVTGALLVIFARRPS